MGAVSAEFPDKLQRLFEPSRYKVLYGGRGGAKSWGVARALLIMGAQRQIRVLCARELQNSIAESVHKLLSDQIQNLGLDSFYTIEKAKIFSPINGTEFYFEGIKNNVRKIKSYEAVDICWVEEAANTGKSSWTILIPTIRKEGSEIWVTFNPELETDETFQRFIKNTPPGTVLIELNWRDNPWFPESLRQEKDYLRETDPDLYLNVWEGKCLVNLEGAVYAKELRKATEEGRITKVPYARESAVDTFWDLGHHDATAIWFAQRVGFEFRVIDYYENRQEPLGHYLDVLQGKRYIYDTYWLPHDARAKSIGTKRSVEEQIRDAGRHVRIVPKLTVADGINAARTIFPTTYFDAEKCADGIQALRHYRYEVVPGTTTYSREPLHDWASHAADAFRYLALALREPRRKPTVNIPDRLRAALQPFASHGWMR